MSAALVVAACGARAKTPDGSLLGPGDHTVTVRGVAIRIHVAGHGPVCLVHPGGPGLEWTSMRMPEVEQHLTLVYVEPIGTGESGRLKDETGYTRHRYADDLDGVRAELGLAETYVLGHSFGGFVALEYALAHGHNVRGLVLYDTSAVTDATFSSDANERARAFANESWFRGAFAELAFEPHTDDEATASFRRGIGLYVADYARKKLDVDRFAESTRVFVGPTRGRDPIPYDVRGKLSTIKAPTLVIVGRKDFICSPKYANVLSAGIAGSQLVTLDESGHFGHFEQPLEFAGAVGTFVNSVEQSTDHAAK
jgi:proline iminopeptidase